MTGSLSKFRADGTAHIRLIEDARSIRLRLSVMFITFIMAAFGPLAQGQRSGGDALLTGWRNPPPDCRMRMFWRVFGPAWTREEIDYQFGELKKAGIGGVTTFFFYPVALDDPSKGIKNQKFLSPEFLETLSYATRKAKQMGLRFTVAGGTGWPFGGPSVSTLDAAQRIRRIVVSETSDRRWNLPTLRPSEKLVAAFSDGKRIPIRDETAEKYEASGLSNGAKIQAYIAGPTGMQVKRPAYGSEGLVVDHFSWEAAKRYLEAVAEPMLKAAPGCIESIFCDSLEVYNSNWTHDFPEQFRKRRGYDIVPLLPVLFGEEGERGRRGEGETKTERSITRTRTSTNRPNTRTPEHLNTQLPDHPTTQLPNNPTTQDLRFDFWRTLAELTEERFTKPLSKWCHAHGVKLEMEAYGTPPNPLTAAQYIDVPTGEQYEWKGFSFSRWAASGAHLTGKRVIGAEAWTWTGIPNRLADSLADLKLCSDYHFLAGINDLTGVEYPYSPRSAGQPGWLPYFGPVMNQNNPQWPFFHYLVEYVNRCQWMLRQGKPVADVAIYLPVEDKMANGPVEQMPLDFLVRDHFVSGKLTGEFSLKNAREHHSELIHSLITNGFQYDGIDFWAMNRLARVEQGRLICGDGEYRIVILPNLQRIDLQALEKLERFCREGGILLATGRIPEQFYGFQPHSGVDDRRVARARGFLHNLASIDSLGNGLTGMHRYGNGWIGHRQNDLVIGTLSSISQWGGADVMFPGVQDQGSFVHRRIGKYDLYLIVNLGPYSFDRVRIHVANRPGIMCDPVTGEVRPLAAVNSDGAYSLFRVNVAAGSSTFLVFQPSVSKTPDDSDAPDLVTSDFDPAGIGERTLALNWRITFEGEDAPKPRETDRLVSWTELPDARYFSGRATYSSVFRWNEQLPTLCSLSVGSIHEVGEVRLNGQIAGCIFLPGQTLDISKLLKIGANSIEITVANLPANHYLGLPDQDLRPLRAVYGNRFPDPQEKRIMKEPAPSGLLGPVTLITYSKK